MPGGRFYQYSELRGKNFWRHPPLQYLTDLLTDKIVNGKTFCTRRRLAPASRMAQLTALFACPVAPTFPEWENNNRS